MKLSFALFVAVLAGAEAKPWRGSVPPGTCMEDNYVAAGNNQGLVCKAKEVYLADIEVGAPATCVAGSFITVDITASVMFHTGRYDVAWYIANDGGDAYRGKCTAKVLRQEDGPKFLVPTHKSLATVGSVQWNNDFKGGNDACGDIFFNTGGGGVLDFTNLGKGLSIPCIDKNGDGTVDFGICFSWRQPGGDDACKPATPFPGSPSKCFCDRYDIPQLKVKKAPTSAPVKVVVPAPVPVVVPVPHPVPVPVPVPVPAPVPVPIPVPVPVYVPVYVPVPVPVPVLVPVPVPVPVPVEYPVESPPTSY